MGTSRANCKPHYGTERNWKQVTAAWNEREDDDLSVSSVKQIGEKAIRKLLFYFADEFDIDPGKIPNEDSK